MKSGNPKHSASLKVSPGSRGFTLIETSIALLILMVATLGVAALFAYSINNNSGANDRALALTIAQQQMEKWRKTPILQIVTPPQPEPEVIMAGRSYSVATTVDGTSSLKRVTVQVTPKGAGANWVRSSVTVVTQRSQTGTGPYLP